MKNLLKKEDGITLVQVLLLIILLTTLGVSILNISLNQYRNAIKKKKNCLLII